MSIRRRNDDKNLLHDEFRPPGKIFALVLDACKYLEHLHQTNIDDRLAFKIPYVIFILAYGFISIVLGIAQIMLQKKTSLPKEAHWAFGAQGVFSGILCLFNGVYALGAGKRRIFKLFF
jgi:hypothetical protein